MARALSVKQPWAALIIYGGKDVENRTWQTLYRGRLLIHASRTVEAGSLRDILTSAQLESLPDNGVPLRCGAIIGEVELADITRITSSIWAEDGHYHWILKNPKAYDTPIFIGGSLGLWEYQGETP